MTDGILNIKKERGYTSHDVVAKLRGILGQKRIGHTGTLDPEAQGVLPVCLGKATRVCDLLTGYRKEYRAVLRLGAVTDTQDQTGRILAEAEVACKEPEIRACVAGFVGRQLQIPPMYSARKVGGKKLYELARRGIEVEREGREIEIYHINIEEIRIPHVVMTVECSKGTYIRTLCHDIGQALGCGGYMESLVRTKVGGFLLEESVGLGEVEELARLGRIGEVLIPTERVFSDLRRLCVAPQGEKPARNGNPLPPSLCLDAGGAQPGERFRLCGPDGEFLAIYAWDDGRGRYVPVKMFV